MRNMRTVLAAALTVLGAAPAVGQEESCERTGSVGIAGLHMEQASFQKQGERWSWSFGTEPRVRSVEDHGQSGDAVREGDVLVAIDGALITTREAGRRLGALEPGERVLLTVRRDGREQELSIRAGSRCVPRPPAAPAAPSPPAAAGAPAPPRAPRADAPAAPPAPPPGLPPRAARPPAAPPPPPVAEAYLGFSFRCSQCGMRQDGTDEARYRWFFFSEPPEVTGVDEEGPARGALRPGDNLVELNGTVLATEAGGRLLGGVQPGDTIVWTVERDGRTLRVTTLAAQPRPRGPTPAAAPAPPAPPAGPSSALRYTGRMGDALVEARGAPVSVIEDPATGEIIIRSGDLWVRVKVLEDGRER